MKQLNLKGILEKEWIIHLPFWLGWIVIMNAGESNGFGYYTQQRHNLLVPLLINTSFNILFFYGNALWLAPKYLLQKKGLAYLGYLLVFSAIFVLLKTGAEKLYINLMLPDLKDIPFASLVQENLYSLPVLALTSYIYYRYWNYKREKEWLTREKLRHELALMKAQVSPHFLFNALNNLYSLGVQGNQEGVNTGILKLSDLLRYMIYDSQLEYISLKKELAYIGDYVATNKLMMKKEELDQVVFKVDGDPGEYKIPPMMLVTFVENAFKHGLSQEGETDIDISALIDQDTLLFQVRNRVSRPGQDHSSKKPYGGLGLSSVKRMLQHTYANEHELLIKEESGYFDVKLKIELKR